MKSYNIDDELIIGINTPKKKEASNKKLASSKKKVKNKKKNNNKNIKRIKFVLKCTSLIILVIILLIFLMVSPIFNITTIEVEGNNLLSKEKVISLSEIQIGENIFRINDRKVKEKIKSNAYIDSVEIKRKFPNSINIIINERSIRYMIEYADGYVYINSQGYMIDISKERKEVPILIGYTTEINNIAIGNRLNVDDLKKLEVANDIIEVSNSNDITSLITKIDISNEENYTLILESQAKTIYLGNCSDLNTRIARAKAILENTEGKEGEIFIDGNTATQNPRFKEKIY